MSEQLQLRRGSASQVAAFTGAQGEVVIDTTNNRAVVQDGVTAGGWPAAKLGEVITNTRTPVADVNYNVQTTDRMVAYTALTASRTCTLPLAANYPLGTPLMIVNETANGSALVNIVIAANGANTIDGAAAAYISSPYCAIWLESNGANAWTVMHQSIYYVPRTTVTDANYSARVIDRVIAYTAITAARTVTLAASNLCVSGATIRIIDESGSASAANPIVISPNGTNTINGVNGSVSITTPYGSIELENNAAGGWFITDSRKGASDLTPVSDAAYAALNTDRNITFVTLTATRIVTLPASASFPLGTALTISDDTGSCSPSIMITVTPNGTDDIDGLNSSWNLQQPYESITLLNTSSGWIVESKPAIAALPMIARMTFVARGISVNATGDTIILLALPFGITKFQIPSVTILNASAAPSSTCRVGVYTGAAQTGFTVATQQAINSITAITQNTAANSMQATLAGANTVSFNVGKVYFNVGTANGSACTVDVAITISPLT